MRRKEEGGKRKRIRDGEKEEEGKRKRKRRGR